MSLRQHLLSPRFLVYSHLDYWPGRPVVIATCSSREEAQRVVDAERLRLRREGNCHEDVWIATEKALAATRA